MALITKRHAIYPMGSNKPHAVLYDGQCYIAVCQWVAPLKKTDIIVINVFEVLGQNMDSIINNIRPKISHFSSGVSLDTYESITLGMPIPVIVITGGESVEKVSMKLSMNDENDTVSTAQKDFILGRGEQLIIPIVPNKSTTPNIPYFTPNITYFTPKNLLTFINKTRNPSRTDNLYAIEERLRDDNNWRVTGNQRVDIDLGLGIPMAPPLLSYICTITLYYR